MSSIETFPHKVLYKTVKEIIIGVDKNLWLERGKEVTSEITKIHYTNLDEMRDERKKPV